MKSFLENVGYDLRLIGKSLRRDPWFTAVMVLTQALSVSIFATALVSAGRYSNMGGQIQPDVYRVEGNHNLILRNFYNGTQFEGFGEFAGVFVSLPSVRALASTDLATHQTVSFVSVMTGGPAGFTPGRLPVRFCNADLFSIFSVDFRYGGPWRRDDERATPPVPAVVLTDTLNQTMFDGQDSVGRTVTVAGRNFRVVGVIRQRPGKVHLWDTGVAPENIGHLLMPFSFADELRPVPVLSWPPAADDEGWNAISNSSSAMTEYWVRLPTPEARHRFVAAVRALNPTMALQDADVIMGRFVHAPAPYRVFVIFTLVVVEASVINVMRMLLAKANARAAEIGIHRALGAGREIIFARQLTEGVLISMAGSVLGLALAIPTVTMFDRLIPDSPVPLALTPATIATALCVCLLAGLVSGIYPAWRVASVSPTRYLGKV